MKNIVLTLCILSSIIAVHAQGSLKGIWNTGKDNTKIEITQEEDVYIGKIISSDNVNAKIGNQLLKDVRLVDGEWKGKLYAPKKKKWLDAVVKEENKQLFITVSAGFMSKTITWTQE